MSDVEHAIGEQMVVEATIAAHLVAMGEAAGVGAKEINRRLRQIANDTVLDEFWITDEKGHAYLTNTNSRESGGPGVDVQLHAACR